MTAVDFQALAIALASTATSPSDWHSAAEAALRHLDNEFTAATSFFPPTGVDEAWDQITAYRADRLQRGNQAAVESLVAAWLAEGRGAA